MNAAEDDDPEAGDIPTSVATVAPSNNGDDDNDVNNNNDDNDANDDLSDSSSSSSSSVSILSEGFQGWARVFYQGRNDRKATQLQPTFSTNLARHSYLYLEIDSFGRELLIYPEDTSKRLIVDPPIPLKHFYATKVPGSTNGAALFLKEDLRPFRRYIFRFEFRNDNVRQPPKIIYDLNGSAKAAKRTMRHMGIENVGGKAKTAFKRYEEWDAVKHKHEKQIQEANVAYIKTLGDMGRDAAVTTDSFVGAVNSLDADLGGSRAMSASITMPKKYGKPSWGPGYEDTKAYRRGSSGSKSSSSSSSSDGTSQYEAGDSDDEKGHFVKTRESVEESFGRMFGVAKSKIKGT